MRPMGMAVALSAAVCTAGVAQAELTLQLDINAIGIQVKDGSGNPTAFGGLTHTGSIELSYDPSFTILNEVAIQAGSGPFVDQNFSGTLSDISGSIELNNGVVVGGSLTVEVNAGGDWYMAEVRPNSGMVQTATTPGGFKIDALTFKGEFSDDMFGNVDVEPWFLAQGQGLALEGSLLKFNFQPDQNGVGFGDLDAFVVVPLPPAGLAGLSVLAAVGGVSVVRRRR